jgi:hypothetical protein
MPSTSSAITTRRRLVGALPAFVIACAAIGTVGGLLLVERLGERYANALDVAADASQLVAESAVPLADLPAEVAEVARSSSAALAEVRSVLDTVSESTTALAEALRTSVGPSISATAEIAERVAGTIEAVDRFIPFGFDGSIADELRAAADGLAPAPEQLDELAILLDAGTDGIDDTVVALRELERRLQAVTTSIDQTAVSIDSLPMLAERVQVEAELAKEGSSIDLWLLRLVILGFGGSLFLIGIALLPPRTTVRALALPPHVEV